MAFGPPTTQVGYTVRGWTGRPNRIIPIRLIGYASGLAGSGDMVNGTKVEPPVPGRAAFVASMAVSSRMRSGAA